MLKLIPAETGTQKKKRNKSTKHRSQKPQRLNTTNVHQKKESMEKNESHSKIRIISGKLSDFVEKKRAFTEQEISHLIQSLQKSIFHLEKLRLKQILIDKKKKRGL